MCYVSFCVYLVSLVAVALWLCHVGQNMSKIKVTFPSTLSVLTEMPDNYFQTRESKTAYQIFLQLYKLPWGSAVV